jgi:acetyl esterase/lipase
MAGAELRSVLDLLRRRAQARQDRPMTREERRRSYDDLGMTFADLAGVAVSEIVDAGGAPAVWVDADPVDAERAILFLHGGGYCQGSTVSHRGLAASLSRACNARVLLLDYRLAPEDRFPAPVEDALAAYRWLLDSGFDAARICVAGDSAGGGLAVSTLVSIREAGLPAPAAGVCLSPWVDMEALGDSMATNAENDPMISREGILDFARTYLNGAALRSPLAAPLYADLTGLPPLLIQVGSAETLLDDSIRLAALANQADLDVTLEVWDGMPHVWHMFAPKLPEGTKAVERIAEFLNAYFGPR